MIPAPIREGIQAAFHDLEVRIESRRLNKTDLRWCLKGESATRFFPDYLILNQFGRTDFESRLNRMVSFFSFRLWQEVCWKRVCAKMKGAYYEDFLSLTPASKAELRRINAFVFKALLAFPSIRYGCFMDVFRFLGAVSRCVHQHYCGHPDPFLDLKQGQNTLCLNILSDIQSELNAHPDTFNLLAVLALRTNWIDNYDQDISAFFHGFREELNTFFDEGPPLSIWRQSGWFQDQKSYKALSKGPMHLLYHLDNSGEVVFDLAWISYLIGMGHRVSVVAKSVPFLNDVTLDEVSFLLESPCFQSLKIAQRQGTFKIVDANAHVAGLDLEVASNAYKEAYKAADLLILKGQGHFQSLPMRGRFLGKIAPYCYKKPMIYAFGLKSDLVILCFRQCWDPSRIPKIGTPMMVLAS